MFYTYLIHTLLQVKNTLRSELPWHLIIVYKYKIHCRNVQWKENIPFHPDEVADIQILWMSGRQIWMQTLVCWLLQGLTTTSQSSMQLKCSEIFMLKCLHHILYQVNFWRLLILHKTAMRRSGSPFMIQGISTIIILAKKKKK